MEGLAEFKYALLQSFYSYFFKSTILCNGEPQNINLTLKKIIYFPAKFPIPGMTPYLHSYLKKKKIKKIEIPFHVFTVLIFHIIST